VDFSTYNLCLNMWRSFEENCEEEEMVDVETIFDNNEENEGKKYR
jgi:hypothetical protein